MKAEEKPCELNRDCGVVCIGRLGLGVAVVMAVAMAVTGCILLAEIGVLTSQSLHLRLVDVQSGEPVEGAVITPFWEADRDHLSLPEGLSDEDLFYYASMWPDPTDENGEIVLDMQGGGVCDAYTCESMATEDFITGEVYLFRIEIADTTEIVKGEVAAGGTISGESYSIDVVSIGEVVVTRDGSGGLLD